MKRISMELTESNSYKSKYLLSTYSNLSQEKQGIVVSKRR